MTTKMALCCSVLLAVLCGGCQQHGDEIRIGEFGSLTGGTATFGTSSHEGVMLALDEINNDGGLLGKKVRVITEDNQSKPEEAVTAVLKLIKQDEVSAVIGEVASSRTLAAAPTCQANHVPLLSPASTNPKVTQVGDYVFRACFIDPFQGSTMAKFAVERLKAQAHRHSDRHEERLLGRPGAVLPRDRQASSAPRSSPRRATPRATSSSKRSSPRSRRRIPTSSTCPATTPSAR